MTRRTQSIKDIRAALGRGEVSLGSWMQIPNASIAEIIGHAGYQWVAIDLEHGAFSLQGLPDVFRALELGGTLPLVRLAQGHPKDCKQALDAGAGGVIVPMVETARQLADARDACRWPPAGKRGVAFSRANLFGKHFDEYQLEAQAPLLVAMIETALAVDNIEEILAVEGLDALLIGPYDLSASLGITAQFDADKFKDAMSTILTLAQQKGVPCGIHVVDPVPEQLSRRIDEGYQFIAYSIDSVFLNWAVRCPKRL